MNSLNDIKEALSAAKHVAIVCHKNPDGDTLGAGFALHRALFKIHIKSDVLCQDTLPTKYDFMNIIPMIHTFDVNKYDTVIFVDCAEMKLAGDIVNNIDFKNIKTINIDHHGTNTQYAKINYVNSAYSSTGELVLDIIRFMEIEMDADIADYLYTAIVTDTGQFAFNYTTHVTHENAAYLIQNGAHFSKLHKKLFNTVSHQKLLLQKQLLNNMQLLENGKIALSTLDTYDFLKSNATAQDSDSFVNILLSIKNVQVAILIRQINDDSCKVSFRSDDQIDISRVAQSFGGGGHKQASGATLQCDIANAPKILVDAMLKLGTLI